ncbi:clathrin heavy chain linker domain-containing protein 1-like [Haliotis rufescens]|uniref:clathrin heavy chain linker domain-containing protein 1-like n=1 Tax=Haliotis rufescens TaxID=6454 RepID=UPI001EAFA10B|nr:clathrin heavy chain linker domain-containing protein 1-like [Haliotis rufescens]
MSSSRSPTPVSSVSAFSKLPPIITSEADRDFLHELSSYIDREMGKIHSDDEEQRYIVYKGVFNKVIEHVVAYKPLLTDIKKEYEDTIGAIRKGQREAVFLQEKLKAMASEPSTIRNYKKRADELEERISIVQKDNGRLEAELSQLKAACMEREKKEEKKEIPKPHLKKDRRQIPGLTLDESTDLKVLYRKLEKLERQMKELNICYKTRYVSKTHKQELKEGLDNKVAHRDHLLWQSQVYREKRMRLKIALEAAEAYNRVKPPHQTVGDAVMLAFAQFQSSRAKEPVSTEGGDGLNREVTPSNVTVTTTTFEEDDPNKEKEAEIMLEYIEKFNELFEDGKFEEAAVHAANSPKGILRTRATLVKFREVKGKFPGRTPLLSFCDALMSSVKEAGSRPNEALSLDCVLCALNENKLDLLYHWLAQDRLTLSLDVGHHMANHCSCTIPCKCGCQALAQSVFMRLQAHRDSVLCLLKQGRVHAGIQFSRNKGVLSTENLMAMLTACPSLKLVHALVEHVPIDQEAGPLLPLGVVLRTLVNKGQTDLIARCLQDLKQGTLQVGDETADSLFNGVFLDAQTSTDHWIAISGHLQNNDYEDTAVQLVATVTVVEALQKALEIHAHKEHDYVQ